MHKLYPAKKFCVRTLAFFLCCVIIFSVSANAFATAASEPSVAEDDFYVIAGDDEIYLDPIEDAQPLDADTISDLIEGGFFEPEDTEILSDEPTYKLEPGKKYTVQEKVCWFKCKVNGATDIQITSSQSADITIYKQTLLGISKEVLYYYYGRTSLDKTISHCSVNNFQTTFLIRVSCSSLSTISCKLDTHVDTCESEYGGIWRPDEFSAMPNSIMVYRQRWYATPTDVSAVYTMVSNSKFLDLQSKLVNGTITTVDFLLGFYTGTSFEAILAKAIGSVFTAAAFVSIVKDPFDFKGEMLAQINECANYKGVDAYNFPIYDNGVCITEYMANEILYYSVEPWYGETMTAPSGWTGTWTIPHVNPFVDVEESDSFYDSVIYLYNRGYMNGTSDNEFSPDSNMRRGDFALLLHRLSGCPAPGALKDTVLKDVPSSAYYYDAVVWAVNKGIINGTEISTVGSTKYITFSPKNSIRNCDLIVMLYRYADMRNFDMDTISGSIKFTDKAKIPSYATTAVKWAIKQNILKNSGDFNPLKASSRANIAIWVAAFCKEFYV